MRPAFGGDKAFAGINADGDLAGEGFSRLAHEVGVLHGHGAEDHAGEAFGQPHLDGGHVADAAAELGWNFDRRQDRLDRRGVDRGSGEGAVEVDQMQPFAASGDEFRRLRCRVVTEDGGLGHLAAQQADALAVFEVDGGVEDHLGGLGEVSGHFARV